MLRGNKLRPLNLGPYLPMLSEGASNWSDLPIVGDQSTRLWYLFVYNRLAGHFQHFTVIGLQKKWQLQIYRLFTYINKIINMPVTDTDYMLL